MDDDVDMSADLGDGGSDLSDETTIDVEDTIEEPAEIEEIDEDVPDVEVEDTIEEPDEIDEDVSTDEVEDTIEEPEIDEIDEDVSADEVEDKIEEPDEIDEDVSDDGDDDSDDEPGEIGEDVSDDGLDDAATDDGPDVPDDIAEGDDGSMPDDIDDAATDDGTDVPDDIAEADDGSTPDDLDDADNDDRPMEEENEIPVEVFKEHQLKPMEEKTEIANRNSDILDWDGDEGDSMRIPKDPDSPVAKALSENGVDGIEYKDGNVDFSPVSKHEVEFEDTDELYKDLSESIKIGSLDSRDDFNKAIRNKWQSLAKREIVDRINNDPEFALQLSQKTGIDTSLVGKNGKMNMTILKQELSRNGLTLHETPDCHKIQFIPTTIHDTFKHSGGTSEMLERLLSADIRGRIYNGH